MTARGLALTFAVLSVVCWLGLLAVAAVSLFTAMPVWLWPSLVGGLMAAVAGLAAVLYRNP